MKPWAEWIESLINHYNKIHKENNIMNYIQENNSPKHSIKMLAWVQPKESCSLEIGASTTTQGPLLGTRFGSHDICMR